MSQIHRTFRVLFCLFLAVAAGTTLGQGTLSPVNVQPGPGNTNPGQIHISGDNIGCVSLNRAQYIIPYNNSFSPPPDLKATGSAANVHDGVSIDGVDLYSDHAVVTVTTVGRHGNQVCDNTYINFTVQAVAQR